MWPRFLSFLIIILLAGCVKDQQVKSPFSGDHTTEQIRGMWLICFQTHRKNIPYQHPQIQVAICDCVVDTSRGNYSSKDYTVVPSDNLTNFFTDANRQCSEKLMDKVSNGSV